MKFARLVVSLVAFTATAFSQAAPSSSFPKEPVRIIVPFPAGGSGDALVRLLAGELNRAWQQTVIVINKPGAGGIIATNEVAVSKPDGHTLGLVFPSFTTNPSINDKLPYDTVRGFVPVTQLVNLPVGVFVSGNSAHKDLTSLIAEAKAKPGVLTYGSAGRGTTSHLAGQLLNQMAGINLVHVPYKGSPPAHLDLAQNRISLMFDSVAAALPVTQDGRVRFVAAAGHERHPLFPDVPTVGDYVKGFAVESYFGIIAPRGVPGSLVDEIYKAFATAMQNNQVSTWLKSQGMVKVVSTPEEFKTFIRDDIDKWAKVVKSLGQKVE